MNAVGAERRIGGFRVIAPMAEDADGKGAVYSAVCEKPTIPGVAVGEQVVLKTLPVCDDDDQYSGFVKRMEFLAHIDHPNVVKYKGYFDGNEAYRCVHVVVMEHLDGKTLKDLISENPGGIDADEALMIIKSALAGLEAANAAGVIHRDIKPGSIFICRDGGVKLIDFDISRNVSATASTALNRFSGSFDYMAPEFVSPEFRGDARSDVFSMGVVMHEALTGKMPYARVKTKGRQADFDFLSRWSQRQENLCVVNIYDSVERLLNGAESALRKALAADPRMRYASAAEFLSALETVRFRDLRNENDTTIVYRMLRIVGRGGFGEVFKARDIGTGELVAVKHLLKGDEEARFRREADVMKKLDNPMFVRFIDFFTKCHIGGNELFLVMAFLPGMPGLSLRDAIRRSKGTSLPPADVLKAFARYAQALYIMHSKGIYHRDIKPSNLYYPAGNPGAAVIMDLGIVRDVDGNTTTGQVPGTLDYMAPELVLNETRGDAGTDIFALGLCLYEALTGKCAYQRLPSGMSGLIALYNRSRERVSPILDSPIVKRDPALLSLLKDMTAVNPESRISSADVLRMRLESLERAYEQRQSSNPTLPQIEPPPSIPRPPRPTHPIPHPPSPDHNWLFYITAILAFACVVVFVVKVAIPWWPVIKEKLERWQAQSNVVGTVTNDSNTVMIVPNTVTNVTNTVTTVAEPVTNVSNTVTNVSNTVTNVTNTVTTVAEPVTNVVDTVTNVSNMGTNVSNTVTNVTNTVTTVAEPVTNVVDTVTNVSNTVTNVSNTVTNVTNTVTTVAEPVTNVVDTVTNVSNTGTNVTKAVTTVAEPVTNVTNTVTNVANKVTTVVNTVMNNVITVELASAQSGAIRIVALYGNTNELSSAVDAEYVKWQNEWSKYKDDPRFVELARRIDKAKEERRRRDEEAAVIDRCNQRLACIERVTADDVENWRSNINGAKQELERALYQKKIAKDKADRLKRRIDECGKWAVGVVDNKTDRMLHMGGMDLPPHRSMTVIFTNGVPADAALTSDGCRPLQVSSGEFDAKVFVVSHMDAIDPKPKSKPAPASAPDPILVERGRRIKEEFESNIAPMPIKTRRSRLERAYGILNDWSTPPALAALGNNVAEELRKKYSVERRRVRGYVCNNTHLPIFVRTDHGQVDVSPHYRELVTFERGWSGWKYFVYVPGYEFAMLPKDSKDFDGSEFVVDVDNLVPVPVKASIPRLEKGVVCRIAGRRVNGSVNIRPGEYEVVYSRQGCASQKFAFTARVGEDLTLPPPGNWEPSGIWDKIIDWPSFGEADGSDEVVSEITIDDDPDNWSRREELEKAIELRKTLETAARRQ